MEEAGVPLEREIPKSIKRLLMFSDEWILSTRIVAHLSHGIALWVLLCPRKEFLFKISAACRYLFFSLCSVLQPFLFIARSSSSLREYRVSARPEWEVVVYLPTSKCLRLNAEDGKMVDPFSLSRSGYREVRVITTSRVSEWLPHFSSLHILSCGHQRSSVVKERAIATCSSSLFDKTTKRT